jgi:hypothetical protein
MNNRWSIEEESRLLKLIASGKTCKELSGGNYNFNRSENALELRLKKIIYENITNKKPVDKIAQLLNMPREKVMQQYYSYKDYMEKQKGVDNSIKSENNIDKLNNLNNQNNNLNNNQKNQISRQSGGNEQELTKLERQNKKMKLLLENYILRHKLSKLIKHKDSNLQKDALNAMIKN